MTVSDHRCVMGPLSAVADRAIVRLSISTTAELYQFRIIQLVSLFTYNHIKNNVVYCIDSRLM